MKSYTKVTTLLLRILAISYGEGGVFDAIVDLDGKDAVFGLI